MNESAARPHAIRDMMARGKRFVVWKYDPDANGNPKKVPYSTAGHRASVTDPTHWDTLEACVQARAAIDSDGIGFVFNGDGLAGADLDGCRDPKTGVIDAWAQQIKAARKARDEHGHLLTEWEREFLGLILQRWSLTEKQEAVLQRIITKIHEATAA